MNKKIINEMDSIATRAMSLLDDLRAYGMCEDADFTALTNIRNKAVGAKKLALHVYYQEQTKCDAVEHTA
jgi:hypothetical protein